MTSAPHPCFDDRKADGSLYHDWLQIKAEIWCGRCGVDYDDRARTHPNYGMTAEQLRRAARSTRTERT